MNVMYVFGLWGDFSIHCNLESLDDIQCDRSLFEKSRQIVEFTKIKMLQISGGQVSDLKRQQKAKNECHVCIWFVGGLFYSLQSRKPGRYTM